MSTRASVVIVPGFWEGPHVFEPLVRTLRDNHNFSNIRVAELASTGQASPGGPTLEDDVKAVRSVIEPIVSAGNDVILLCHSAGGYIGAGSTASFTKRERSAQDLPGGITALAFFAAGVFPVGTSLVFRDFFMEMSPDGKYLLCKEPRKTLFSDFDDANAEKYERQLLTQPGESWKGEITHNGAADCDSWYLICEGDAVFPKDLQKMVAEGLGATIETCEGGHMVQLKDPDVVAAYVDKVAKVVERK